MDDRAILRTGDIKDAIASINDLLSHRTFEDVTGDKFVRAAFERFLEIISEASRHIPADWKAKHDEVAWRRIADLGNVIRHAYDQVDLGILWSIYEKDLTSLDRALDDMVAAHGPRGDVP